MRPTTARGFRDVLPAEASERELVARRCAETFSAWGYEPVETPVVEDLASLEAAAGPLEGVAFRLVDSDGRLLALRPDMTVPIARLSASRMAEELGPMRFRYCAEVFREHESLRGQARGFTQVGVELVGEGGPAGDAEVVAVLVEGLEAAGIRDFTVGVGTVAVLHALVASAQAGSGAASGADAGADAAWGRLVLEAAHNRNLVGLDVLASAAGSDAVAAALRTVPRIRGGAEAIATCRAATRGLGCDDALDSLAATWELLVAAGVSECVVIDFSVMRSFDYYTGMVLEVFAPGLGLPLGGGGRYDGVLAAYDSPLPAAGFALGLERMMIALVEQGVEVTAPRIDALVGGEPAAALKAAAKLRATGKRVAVSSASGEQLAAEARRLGAAQAWAAAGGELRAVSASGAPAADAANDSSAGGGEPS